MKADFPTERWSGCPPLSKDSGCFLPSATNSPTISGALIFQLGWTLTAPKELLVLKNIRARVRNAMAGQGCRRGRAGMDLDYTFQCRRMEKFRSWGTCCSRAISAHQVSPLAHAVRIPAGKMRTIWRGSLSGGQKVLPPIPLLDSQFRRTGARCGMNKHSEFHPERPIS